MLEIAGLTTHYGSSQALFGVDLKLEAGQVATLLGRNGMGKTTTINSVMGIVPASGGSVLFEGHELVGRKSFRIANLGLGLVPEGRQIFPNLSLMENLVATASNHLGIDDPWTVERVFALFPELETRTSSMPRSKLTVCSSPGATSLVNCHSVGASSTRVVQGSQTHSPS